MGATVASPDFVNPLKLAGAGTKFEMMQSQVSRFSVFFREKTAMALGRKEIEPIGDAKNPQFSGALFERWSDLSGDMGGNEIQMPVFGKMSKPWVAGSQNAENTGEVPPIYGRKMYLSEGTKVFQKTVGIAAQKLPLTLLNAVNNANSWLYEWWGGYQDGAIQMTLLTGHDPNMSFYTNYWSIPGIGTDDVVNSVVSFSHPNIFVPTSGFVSWANGKPLTQGYENSVIGALQGVYGNLSMAPTCDTMIEADDAAASIGIPRLDLSIGQFRVWFMDPSTLRALKKSKGWNDRQTQMYKGMGQSPDSYLYTGANAIFEGQIIYVIPGCWGVQFSAGTLVTNAQAVAASQTGGLTMPQYGPTTFWVNDDPTLFTLDMNPVKFAFICAPHCLHGLQGRKSVEFQPGNRSNFRDPSEIAMRWTKMWERDDVFDPRAEKFAANTFLYNASSMVVPFWSPPMYNATSR